MTIWTNEVGTFSKYDSATPENRHVFNSEPEFWKDLGDASQTVRDAIDAENKVKAQSKRCRTCKLWKFTGNFVDGLLITITNQGQCMKGKIALGDGSMKKSDDRCSVDGTMVEKTGLVYCGANFGCTHWEKK